MGRTTKISQNTDSPVKSGLGKHMADQHRDTGWCERCRRDEARPIYEVMTAQQGDLSIGGGKVDYRYLCRECAEKFAGRSLEHLLEVRRTLLAASKEKREQG